MSASSVGAHDCVLLNKGVVLSVNALVLFLLAVRPRADLEVVMATFPPILATECRSMFVSDP
jgi:hypothetical protein